MGFSRITNSLQYQKLEPFLNGNQFFFFISLLNLVYCFCMYSLLLLFFHCLIILPPFYCLYFFVSPSFFLNFKNGSVLRNCYDTQCAPKVLLSEDHPCSDQPFLVIRLFARTVRFSDSWFFLKTSLFLLWSFKLTSKRNNKENSTLFLFLQIHIFVIMQWDTL